MLVRRPLSVENSLRGFLKPLLGFKKSMVDTLRATGRLSRTLMNRDQLNRTDMFSTVSSYMDINKAIFAGVKAVKDAVIELDANIAAITTKAGKQEAPIGGAADEKEQVRLAFEEKILEIEDQLSALAEKNKNANLAAQVELTLSGLDKLGDDELGEMGKRISDLATANLAALVDYDIKAADVTALDALKSQFNGIKSAPRTAIAGRKGETDTLPQIITDNTSLLRNRLDKLMTKFKKTNSVFFAGYRSARVVVDRGGSPKPAPAPAPTP